MASHCTKQGQISYNHHSSLFSLCLQAKQYMGINSEGKFLSQHGCTNQCIWSPYQFHVCLVYSPEKCSQKEAEFALPCLVSSLCKNVSETYSLEIAAQFCLIRSILSRLIPFAILVCYPVCKPLVIDNHKIKNAEINKVKPKLSNKFK